MKYSMKQSQLKDFLKDNFTKINDHCVAIYRGGSSLDPVIIKPHDDDYICFAKSMHRHLLLNVLRSLGFKLGGSTAERKKPLNNLVDISQVRTPPYTQITWFSYLDVLMEKIVGEDVCPKTDIIYEHRAEFLNTLHAKVELLESGAIWNKKRWYHILRGVYILLNNSYEVTEEQKREINILHDLSEGWEEIKDKTIKLLQDLK